MLKRLQLKFVCITMAIVAAMLCVIFSVVLRTMQQNLERQSQQMLHELAQGPRPKGRPGEMEEQILLPYFAMQVMPGGAFTVTGGEFYDLSDTAFLVDVVGQVMAADENVGNLPEYDLRYYRTANMRGLYIVFTDTSHEQQVMQSLTVTCLGIGVASFGVLLGISFFLAKWAVRPVERAWAEQRQFVADASHELKTPLTVIMTNAELLSSVETGDSRTQQFVDSIQTMACQMRGLVEGLLELARVDNGAVKMAFQELNISELLSDTVLPFEAVFFEADLDLQLSIQPGICVKGSQSHLRQVVEILLDNARKYSVPPSAVRLSLQKTGGKECRLAISNCGETIAQEDLENIFKRFFRTDKVRAMDHSYGLGLPIAQAIVKDHKGKIWAESRDGVNTFFVQLPTV